MEAKYLTMTLEQAIYDVYAGHNIPIDVGHVKMTMAQYLFDPIVDARQKNCGSLWRTEGEVSIDQNVCQQAKPSHPRRTDQPLGPTIYRRTRKCAAEL